MGAAKQHEGGAPCSAGTCLYRVCTRMRTLRTCQPLREGTWLADGCRQAIGAAGQHMVSSLSGAGIQQARRLLQHWGAARLPGSRRQVMRPRWPGKPWARPRSTGSACWSRTACTACSSWEAGSQMLLCLSACSTHDLHPHPLLLRRRLPGTARLARHRDSQQAVLPQCTCNQRRCARHVCGSHSVRAHHLLARRSLPATARLSRPRALRSRPSRSCRSSSRPWAWPPPRTRASPPWSPSCRRACGAGSPAQPELACPSRGCRQRPRAAAAAPCLPLAVSWTAHSWGAAGWRVLGATWLPTGI